MTELVETTMVWVKGLPLGRRRRLVVYILDHGPRVREWTVCLSGWRRTYSVELRRHRMLPGD